MSGQTIVDINSDATFTPSELLFTESKIDGKFEDGMDIDEMIQKAANPALNEIQEVYAKVRAILPLKVRFCKAKKSWYCDSNEELYFLRVLEKKGKVEEIKVHMTGNIMEPAVGVGCHVVIREKTEREREMEIYRLTNLRMKKLMPHCNCWNQTIRYYCPIM